MKKIYVDAGHGGADSGAVGIGNVHEADVNLLVAKYLKAELERNGFAVKMSRTADVKKDLPERSSEANKWGADVYISVHCNWSKNAAANGTETYVYKYGGNAEKIANKVQSKLVAALNTDDRGVKEGNLHVLRETNAPAVLCELAFVSNKSDCGKLINAAYQKQCAVAICKGVCEFYNKAYKGEKTVDVKRDNTPAEWAKDAVNWAVKEGILKGDENGDYALHSNITVERFLVFLYRALNK